MDFKLLFSLQPANGQSCQWTRCTPPPVPSQPHLPAAACQSGEPPRWWTLTFSWAPCLVLGTKPSSAQSACPPHLPGLAAGFVLARWRTELVFSPTCSDTLDSPSCPQPAPTACWSLPNWITITLVDFNFFLTNNWSLGTPPRLARPDQPALLSPGLADFVLARWRTIVLDFNFFSLQPVPSQPHIACSTHLHAGACQTALSWGTPPPACPPLVLDFNSLHTLSLRGTGHAGTRTHFPLGTSKPLRLELGAFAPQSFVRGRNRTAVRRLRPSQNWRTTSWDL